MKAIKKLNHLSIYIHIPFCIKKCNYCDFYSISSNEYLHKKYVEKLVKEIATNAEIFNYYTVDTIFIGGGTPTCIDLSLLEQIIKCIYNNYNVNKTIEFTCEANPETINDRLVNNLLSFGVNRLSIGIQSTNDDVLSSIFRVHNSKKGIDALKIAKKNGFNNINADLMYGLPYQSIDIHNESIYKILDIGVQHVSAYNLIVEESTALQKMINNGLKIPDEDEQIAMYLSTKEILNKNMLIQYEISNYAKAGFESKHNLAYWERKPYIGFGASAHSFVEYHNNKIRFSNPNDIEAYFNDIEIGKRFINNAEIINKNGEAFETIMLGLRMNKGINLQEFEQTCKMSIEEYSGENYYNLLQEGLLIKNNNYLYLSEKGQLFLNYIIQKMTK